MFRFLFAIIIITSQIACNVDDQLGNLVVDSLDMSSNDFSLQIDYKSEFEIFKNERYDIVISHLAPCDNPYVRKRVLPKHGNLEITESLITYYPIQDYTGLDSIQFEICCGNICNVHSARILILRDIGEKCMTAFSNLSKIHYYKYSIGSAAVSSIIKFGLLPPTGCEQYLYGIQIIREPIFGFVKIDHGKTLSYEGDLPRNSSDTVIYILNITIDSQLISKTRTLVIERRW